MVTPLSVVGISRYHRPAAQFEPIRRDFLRDAHDPHTNRPLSLRAFRVASFILAHAEGFVQTQEQIARRCGLSVTTVRAALDDLRRAGYLASRRLREGGRWVGTAYAVSDQPFTEDELALLCPPGAESECSDSERSESVGPKETTPARETTTPKKTTPSGGRPAVAAEPPPVVAPEEHPMPDAAQGALFDPQPTEDPKPGEDRRSPAQRVTAAFVDAHRQAHGMEPTKRAKGRVARDVKALLEQAPEEELVRAATAMGAGTFDNLVVQLKILRRGGQDVKGFTPAREAGRPAWVEGRAQTEAEAAALAAEDPEMAAWLAGVA